jgi:AcrR family transcriptional regulator
VPPKRRRTQEERRTATRAALLDATIDCLIEDGYSATTTNKIVARAGVSRGAQVHHFPTKAELVAQAIRHLAAKRQEELISELPTLPTGAKRLDAALDLMWHQHSGPLFQAAMELWVAARTDPELRDELLHVEREIVEEVWEGAADLFGDAARSREFRGNIETAMATMRGIALLTAVTGDADGGGERLWRSARKRLRKLFDGSLENGSVTNRPT